MTTKRYRKRGGGVQGRNRASVGGRKTKRRVGGRERTTRRRGGTSLLTPAGATPFVILLGQKAVQRRGAKKTGKGVVKGVLDAPGRIAKAFV